MNHAQVFASIRELHDSTLRAYHILTGFKEGDELTQMCRTHSELSRAINSTDILARDLAALWHDLSGMGKNSPSFLTKCMEFPHYRMRVQQAINTADRLARLLEHSPADSAN